MYYLNTFHLQVSNRFNVPRHKLNLSRVFCSHVAHEKKMFCPWNEKNSELFIIKYFFQILRLSFWLKPKMYFCLFICFGFCKPSWRILMVLVGCIRSLFLYHSPGTSSTEISQTNTAFSSSWMSRSSRPWRITSSRSVEFKC